MGDTIHVPRAIPRGGSLPSDDDSIAEAVRLKQAIGRQPDAAKKHLLMWLLIEAHERDTTLGGVLDNLVRTQPSRNDQYGLLRRFRAALREDA